MKPNVILTEHGDTTQFVFDVPLEVQISSASCQEPNLTTINLGTKEGGNQFPPEVNTALRTLEQGSIVVLNALIADARIPWAWAFRINREGAAMSSRFKPSGQQAEHATGVGAPKKITVVSMLVSPIVSPT